MKVELSSPSLSRSAFDREQVALFVKLQTFSAVRPPVLFLFYSEALNQCKKREAPLRITAR